MSVGLAPRKNVVTSTKRKQVNDGRTGFIRLRLVLARLPDQSEDLRPRLAFFRCIRGTLDELL